MKKKLVVVTGGLSEESATNLLADSLAKAVMNAGARGGVEITVSRIALRDLSAEIAQASVTGFASGALQSAYNTLADADAVIAATPTYKASYTGLFKAFWDVTADGVMSGVPVILAATGGSSRHSLVTDYAMRPLFAYMKALTMPTAVYAAAEDWASTGLSSRMGEAASELVRQLVGSTSAALTAADADGERTLKGTRERAKDPFANFTSMEELLAG